MFMLLQVKVPLVFHLRLVASQINLVGTTRKFLQTSHLLQLFIFCYTTKTGQLFLFIALGNKDGDNF